MISEVLAEAGIGMGQLNGVVVCAGPGSYTGLRIGMATAKAICYVADIPLFLDNKLTLLTHQAILSAEKQFDLYVAGLIAREKEYFVAAYDKSLNAITEPRHIGMDELTGILHPEGHILLTGNIKPEELNGLGIKDVHIYNSDMFDFEGWASYAIEQYKCNGNVNLAMAEPFYLKQVYTHNPKSNS